MCFELELATASTLHQNRTVVVLKNPDARVLKNGQEKTPDRPQETCLLETFRHRNILPLTQGECGALLRPRSPLDGCTPTHHGSTLYRRLLSFLGSIGCIRVNHHVKFSTSPSQNRSHFSVRPTAKQMSSTCTTAITETDPALINLKHRDPQGSAQTQDSSDGRLGVCAKTSTLASD